MLTTVCVSCSTEFRVTPEQLKIRDGRVRCGRCDSVFNALSTLTQRVDREEAAEVPATESAANWPRIDPVEFPPLENPTQAPAPYTSAAAVLPSIPKHQEFGFHTAAQSAGTAPNFDFGPKASARRGWWWTPLWILLFLGLLAQSVFYFRGAIAFMIPQTKPAIIEICAELGCEVPLPRRAELISIESSDLQADPTNPGVIVLLATLRNRAAFPQTFPALELTLTNERDQPLARRVLQSNDYLADKTEVFEGSSEKQIRLNLEAGSLKASGYRLYLFYP